MYHATIRRISFSNVGWLAGVVLVGALAVNDCRSSAVGDSRGKPLPVTVVAASVTAEPNATPAPLPQPPGTPQRVNFDKGSYGATLAGTTSTRYLLWAAQGQTFTTTLTASSTALVSLYGPDGKPLYEQLAAGYTAAATLPSNGDYALEVRSSGAYTVGVEIR